MFFDDIVQGPPGVSDAGYHIVSAEAEHNDCLLFCLTAIHETDIETLRSDIVESARYHFEKTLNVARAVIMALMEDYTEQVKVRGAVKDMNEKKQAAAAKADELNGKMKPLMRAVFEHGVVKMTTTITAVMLQDKETMLAAYSEHILGGRFKGGSDVTVLNYHSMIPKSKSTYDTVQKYSIGMRTDPTTRRTTWCGELMRLGINAMASPPKSAFAPKTDSHFNMVYHARDSEVTIVFGDSSDDIRRHLRMPKAVHDTTPQDLTNM